MGGHGGEDRKAAKHALDDDVSDVTLDDMIACVSRELRMREGVYPKWVASGRMRQSAADLELRRMRAVFKALISLRRS